jgi:hypothetical protein
MNAVNWQDATDYHGKKLKHLDLTSLFDLPQEFVRPNGDKERIYRVEIRRYPYGDLVNIHAARLTAGSASHAIIACKDFSYNDSSEAPAIGILIDAAEQTLTLLLNRPTE